MATLKHLEVQPSAKNVTVYRNGDLYFPGRKFVVNDKQVRNFDSFLNQVTNGLGARFGAVRNIWTPTHGHRVRELESIDNGKTYVAGGFERFRKMDYDHIASKLQEQRSPRMKKTFSQVRGDIKPVQHSRLQRSAQYLKASQATGPVTIHIYRNGEPARRPMKLLLTKYMMRTLENVLEYVAQKVELSTGAVRSPYDAPAYQIPSIGKIVSPPSKRRRQSVRLFTMDFAMVEDLSQVQNGQYYVAVGMQRLQKLPYGDTSLNSSLGTTAAIRRRKPRPLHPGKYAKPKETKKEENSVFHHKPAKVKRSPKSNTTSVLNSEHSGSGGPFHASSQREETKDAGIVGENEDTKVELPIDQVEADEVEEEEINTGQDTEVKLSESGRQTYSKDEGQRTSSPGNKPDEIVEESPSGERNDSHRSHPSSPPHSKPNTPPRGKSSTPPPDNSNSPAPNNRTSPSPSNRNSPPLNNSNTPPPSDRNSPPPNEHNTPPPDDRNSPPPKERNTPPPNDNNSPPPNARNSSSQSKRNSPSPSKSPTKDLPNTPRKSPSPANPPASKPTTPDRVNSPEKAENPERDTTPPAVVQDELNNKPGGPEANKTEEQLAEEGA
ncbi:doublecortin domain-containing protein 2-like isoform X3 [Branchiostoma lanceolatum]|uniref:doublecortin domain-containing protein 2-like isoform X3 n=1 Tax=Branchiostoma lanceolatum TaxID=7740 RepID=UPI003451C1A6